MMKTPPPLLLSLLLLSGLALQADAAGPSTSAQAATTAQDSSESRQDKTPVVVESITVSASIAETGRDPASFATLSREEIAAANRGHGRARGATSRGAKAWMR